MNNAFCTISTLSHLYKCKALFDSLKMIDSNVHLHILIIDATDIDELEVEGSNCYFYSLSKCEMGNTANLITKKYKQEADKLRWSMKPVFMQYLMLAKDISKLVYVDNDIAFFGNYDFLFELLEGHNILLTPHFYERNPKENQNWLEANFRVGLFNAGFIAANKKAVSTLEWWANCCLYRCEKSYMRGLFDDQKYLDLFPIIEPTTKILDHQGCNLAGWNIGICKRTKQGERVLINEKWPVVFVHFNPMSIKFFLEDKDPLLKPFFKIYSGLLKKHSNGQSLVKEAFSYSLVEKLKLKVWHLLNRLNKTE